MTRRSHSSKPRSCFSMRLTSVRLKPKLSKPRTAVYRAQCLFFGEESLRFLAARISEAKKIRWAVHFIPFATGGRRCWSLPRYTREVISVGTCTWDRSTSVVMNSSNDGSAGSAWERAASCGGVVGGVGGRDLLFNVCPSQRITWAALCPR